MSHASQSESVSELRLIALEAFFELARTGREVSGLSGALRSIQAFPNDSRDARVAEHVLSLSEALQFRTTE